MSERKMRAPFGRGSIAFVVFAVVLAAAGLVWAHWFASLHVDANINTGNVGIEWVSMWTNDDGVNDGDGEDGGPFGAWDNWGEGSSADPSDFGGGRYDKDVGGCWVNGGGDNINININNGYPSYHCSVFAEVQNSGSVPVKALPANFSMVRGGWQCDWYEYNPATDEWGPQVPNIEGDEGGDYIENGESGSGFEPGVDYRIFWYDDGEMSYGYVDLNDNGQFDEGEPTVINDCQLNGEELAVEDLGGGMLGWGYYDETEAFVAEITGFLPSLFGCGEQIDPGIGGQAEFGFHIEQPAQQGASYVLQMHQEFVNWNEFDDGWCEPQPEPLRVWSSQLNFSSTGWGGWSCPASHPDAVAAGVSKVSGSEVAPDYPIEVRVAEPGMATFDTYDYPTFPHYTYPAGEEGVAAHNGGTGQSVFLWVDCLE